MRVSSLSRLAADIDRQLAKLSASSNPYVEVAARVNATMSMVDARRISAEIAVLIAKGHVEPEEINPAPTQH